MGAVQKSKKNLENKFVTQITKSRKLFALFAIKILFGYYENIYKVQSSSINLSNLSLNGYVEVTYNVYRMLY